MKAGDFSAGQIVLEVPNELQSHWEQLAKASGQSLKGFIVKELSKRCPPIVSQTPETEDPREFVKAILREAGLLEEFKEEEKRRCQPMSKEERRRLAEKVGRGKNRQVKSSWMSAVGDELVHV